MSSNRLSGEVPHDLLVTGGAKAFLGNPELCSAQAPNFPTVPLETTSMTESPLVYHLHHRFFCVDRRHSRDNFIDLSELQDHEKATT